MFKFFECMMMQMRIYGFMMFHVSYIPGAHQISSKTRETHWLPHPVVHVKNDHQTLRICETAPNSTNLQWLFMAKLPQLLKQCKQRFIWNHTTTKDIKAPCKPSNLRQTGLKFISCRIHVQESRTELYLSHLQSIVKDGHFIDKMAMAQNHEPGQSTIVPKPELRRCWDDSLSKLNHHLVWPGLRLL